MELVDDLREKRLMACANCRRLKVKCVHSDPNDLLSPCIRCLKGKKECKFTVTRRRRNARLDLTSQIEGNSAKIASLQVTPEHEQSGTPRGVPRSGLGFGLGRQNGLNAQVGQNVPNLPNVPNLNMLSMYTDREYKKPIVEPLSDSGQPFVNPAQLNGAGSGPNSGGPFTDFSYSLDGKSSQVNANVNVNPLIGASPMSSSAQTTPEFDRGQSQETHLPLQGSQGMLLYQIEATPRFRFMNAKIMDVRNTLLLTWKKITEMEMKASDILQDFEDLGYKRAYKPENSVIAQGIITREEAAARIEEYKNYYYKLLPIVMVPPGDTVEEMIANAPVLFTCIMSITSATMPGTDAKKSIILNSIASITVNYEILVQGNKSIELLHAALLRQMWYNEPVFYHRQRVQLNSHVVRALAYDLGLGGRQPYQSKTYVRNAIEEIWIPKQLPGHSSPDSYNVWLVVYALSFLVFSSNLGPTPSFWNHYTINAVEEMSNLPQLTPESYRIADIAVYIHLMEQVAARVLKRDNEPHAVDVNDPATHEQVADFDTQIEKERATRAASSYDFYLSAKIYLHQYVLYGPYNAPLGRSFFTNLSLRMDTTPLSEVAANSFKITSDYCAAYIDWVLGMPAKQLCLLTVVQLSSLKYNAAVLIKCRMLVILNKSYADVQNIISQDEVIDRLTALTTYIDQVTLEYPFLNDLTATGFLVKLLLTRGDDAIQRALQYLASVDLKIQRPSVDANDEVPNSYDENHVDGTDQGTETGYDPGSVSELFKSISRTGLTPPPNVDDQMGEDGRRSSAYFRERFSSLTDEQQLWNLGGDFWKDVLPNDGFQWFDI